MIKLLGLPPLSSVHGKDVDMLIFLVHILMGLLFVGWLAFFIITLVRFHHRRNPKANYHGAKSGASSWVEGAVILAEAVLLIGFAVPLWAKVADEFPPESESTVIRVIAEQFAWNTFYPGPDGKFGRQDPRLIAADNPLGQDRDDPNGKDDFTTPEVFVPVNKPVIAHISSKDVIHSFKVNPLRVTQDAIPGIPIPAHFTPTQEGSYLINCAQLCGNAHAFMKGKLTVLSQAEYDAWVAQQVQKAATSTGPVVFE